MMVVDHMESLDICGVKGVDRTRCGQKINSTPGYVFEYGSQKCTCKACNRLYAADLLKTAPAPSRKHYKCARTDCGRPGCESSSLELDPPEFCIYDFDEAYWVEVKGGVDQ